MRTRVIVGCLGVVLLLVVLLALPAAATMIFIAALAVVAAHELTRAAGISGRLTTYTMVAAVLVPIWCFFSHSLLLLELGAFIYLVVLAVELIVRHGTEKEFSYKAALVMLFGGIVVPLLLCSLLRLRMEPWVGRCLVFAPLVTAFAGDTAALYAGMHFGEHKLAPAVSPNKTLEGSIGGLIGSVVCIVLFGLVVHLVRRSLPWSYLLMGGVLGAILGQLGDLFFSVIKRECGVKDYGRLLPGHGGVLDRFDSVLFTAPLFWLLWNVL